MAFDPTKVKLGCLPPKQDSRTLRFARYVTSQLPKPPALTKWAGKTQPPWHMYLNDRIGDCTCASAGHAIQVWTANATKEVEITDQDVLQAYMAISGYDPNTGANDNGAVVIDLMNYWRHLGIGGRKIEAYAAVHPQSPLEVEEAIYYFGGCYIGIALPMAAQQQQGVWSVPRRIPWMQQYAWRPGTWGGHAVFVYDYDRSKQLFKFTTWGSEMACTYRFFVSYVMEAYAILTPDWFDASNQAPNGFDLAALRADLAHISGTQGDPLNAGP
jgi:hypothetical protein